MQILNKKTFIFVIMLLTLLPIMLLRDFTPDNELRYLSIADEALRNHTFFAFTNHGVAYADKPPFTFGWSCYCVGCWGATKCGHSPYYHLFQQVLLLALWIVGLRKT